MIHRKVTMTLLAVYLLPLIKGLKNKASTDNYRLITGTSLLLIIYECVILIIWGPEIRNNDLTFGFLEGTGSSQCMWSVQETLNYFLRVGSKPFLVSPNCTKAFPSYRWDTLCGEMYKQLPTIVVRVILYSYVNQKVYIIWGDSIAIVFTVRNGTREGKVASLVFWGMYILPLITKSRKLGIGCHIGNLYVASILFADDITLISANRTGAQLMLSTCEKGANNNDITFSTDLCPVKSKTKVMWVTGTVNPQVIPAPLELNGRELPFVNSLVHLGHTLAMDGKMNKDMLTKEMTYISKCDDVETFSFLHPRKIQKCCIIHILQL